MHQTAVAQPVHACGCVDARDPQCPELALALATIAIGVLPGLDDGLLGDPEHLSARAVVSLGLIENLLVPRLGHDSAFDSGHNAYLS